MLVLSVALGGLLGLGACSDDPLTQPGARDGAAAAVCDWAGRCGNIGAGKTYESRQSCLVTWTANIEKTWTPATCKKIVQAEYDLCVDSIKLATCENGVDLVAVLSKCGADKVCLAQ